MPCGFKAVRVLSRIRVGGAGHQRGGVVAQGLSKLIGQGGPCFGVKVAMGDKSPRRHHKGDACNGKAPANKIRRKRSRRFHGSIEPRPFFKMGMAVQLLGVKQYFTSSFKLSLRSSCDGERMP